jgi:hypothetical protein
MKIYTYNTPLVHNLIENKKIPKQFLSENWEEDYLYCQNHNFSSNYFMYDRTGSINHFLNIDSEYSKLPTMVSSKSFTEVAEERAKYLLSLGKPINVSWSGGIDSTFVLFCLYHYAEDKSQITVYGTYNSIIESGYLFDRYIKNRIKYNIVVNPLHKNTYKADTLYVTGALSNQLFQPGIKYAHNRDNILKIKSDTFIEDNLFSEIEDILDDDVLEFITPCFKNFPKKIITLQELRWFINFNFCWYNNSSHHKIGSNNENILAFFDTDEFQLWSIYNKDIPTKIGDYSDERWQIRELIEEYTGDKLYAKNKKKNVSVLSPLDTNWLFLLNDYSNIYLEDLQNPNSLSYK